MSQIINHAKARLTHTVLFVRTLWAFARCIVRGRGREASLIIIAIAEASEQAKPR